MKLLFAILPAFCMTAVAFAVNSLEQEFKCPFDGTIWKQRIETSASPRGLRSDLRQLGDVVDPPTLPQCPKCRFPIFSDNLAEQANDPRKAKAFNRLKSFVLGADFQMLASKNPSYFTLAQVQEFLPAPHRYIALSYLRASWQVEERDAVCQRFLEKAHDHFAAAVSEMKATDRHFADTVLLCGEVERRLGMWDEAGKRFRDLQGTEGWKDSKLKPIVALQMKLIEQHDPIPHALDDSAEAHRPNATQAPNISIKQSAPLRSGLERPAVGGAPGAKPSPN